MSAAYEGLHIWGRMSSINVKKVVWTAQELGLEFQRTEAGGLFGIVKTPEYMRLNPNSLVPVLQDGDHVLWESNVIVRYLCAKHSPGNFYPTELSERFDAERWMEWQQTTVNPASRPGFWQLIRTPEAERNMAVVAESNAAVESLMALLDAHLANRHYLVGDRFSMADIPLACEVHRWFGMPQPRQARPHIERWYDSIRARQTSKGVLDMPLA
ncbi:MAG: glutathione S-transferase-like protein [Polaromonas sp.]|nr:glutathione S-transferase-like protein [Polaromonas sp.]